MGEDRNVNWSGDPQFDNEPSDAFMKATYERLLTDLPPREHVRLGGILLSMIWVDDRETVVHEDHVDFTTKVEAETYCPTFGLEGAELEGMDLVKMVADALDRFLAEND